MSELSIRALRAEDRDSWQPLWEAYLRFYRAAFDADVADQAFTRLSQQLDGMFGLVAERDGQVIGIAHVVVHASTWLLAGDTYLQDLFVDPAARGAGAGRALIEAVYARADELGVPHVYWRTQEFNAPARSLYEELAQLTSDRVYER